MHHVETHGIQITQKEGDLEVQVLEVIPQPATAKRVGGSGNAGGYSPPEGNDGGGGGGDQSTGGGGGGAVSAGSGGTAEQVHQI